VNRRRRNTEVTLKVGFCRWLFHDLGVVVDEGEVLTLLRRPAWRCVCRHKPIPEMSDVTADCSTPKLSTRLILLRFVVPLKSFWLHEAACVELMVNEADDGIATLWARKVAILFKHPNRVFNRGPQLRVLEVSIPF
jgi:hypothetical protein